MVFFQLGRDLWSGSSDRWRGHTPADGTFCRPLLSDIGAGAASARDEGRRWSAMEKDAPKGSIVGILSQWPSCFARSLIYRFANWPLLLSLDFGVLWQYRGILMSGLGTTFLIMAVSGVVGLGVGSALGRQAEPIPLLAPALGDVAYVEIWRNTPLLVQVVWLDFALPLVTGYSTSALQSGLLRSRCRRARIFRDHARRK